MYIVHTYTCTCTCTCVHLHVQKCITKITWQQSTILKLVDMASIIKVLCMCRQTKRECCPTPLPPSRQLYVYICTCTTYTVHSVNVHGQYILEVDYACIKMKLIMLCMTYYRQGLGDRVGLGGTCTCTCKISWLNVEGRADREQRVM